MNVRQFSYVLLAVLVSASAFVQCNSTQASSGGQSDDNPAGLDRAAHHVVESLKTGEYESVLEFMPDYAMARILSPENTNTLSDQEIESQMLTPVKQRFADNLEKIRQAVVGRGHNITSVSLAHRELHVSEDPPLVPRVMTLSLKAGSETASFPITYLVYEGRVYLFEILKTTGIFK